MTVDEILLWVPAGKGGESVVYHEGFLAFDCVGDKESANAAREMRSVMAALQKTGIVNLFQKRILPPILKESGDMKYPGVYAYIAQRTSKEFDLNAFQRSCKRRAQPVEVQEAA